VFVNISHFSFLKKKTTSLTTINKSILVNDFNFTIEINTINHFLNNPAQTLNDYNLETEGENLKVKTKLNYRDYKLTYFKS